MSFLRREPPSQQLLRLHALPQLRPIGGALMAKIRHHHQLVQRDTVVVVSIQHLENMLELITLAALLASGQSFDEVGAVAAQSFDKLGPRYCPIMIGIFSILAEPVATPGAA